MSFHQIDVSNELRQFLWLVDSLRKHNGIQFTIAYLKCAKLHITRYICKQPLLVNTNNVSVTRDGFPVRLLFLRKLIDSGDRSKIRACLTILSIIRTLEPTKKEESKISYDTTTITDGYKGKNYVIPLWFIRDFVVHYKLILPPPTYKDDDHYLSMKSSPCGPATISAWRSILQLPYPLLDACGQLLGDYVKRFDLFYKVSFKLNHILPQTEKTGCGQLAIVKDPELKRRVIAMVDYYSQFILRPVHEGLLGLLRDNLPCDRTFTQDPHNKWEANSEKFWSLDLSAATDRFPIKLQKRLLRIIYDSKELSEAWERLLVDRDFKLPKSDNTVRYSVGQPMGAYSSWAAFALTHHLVVAWAAHLCGLPLGFNQYILLGDDIVVKNDKVAKKYIVLMTRWGVDISPHKTHVSKNTYEFAKRWISSGVELSGLPLKGIAKNLGDFKAVYLTIYQYALHIPPKVGTVLHLVAKLYDGLKVNGRWWTYSKAYKSLYDFNTAVRYSFGLISYDELRNFLAIRTHRSGDFILPWEGSIHSVLNGILSYGMVQMAMNSNMEITKILNSLRAFLGNEALGLLGCSPLILGIYNHLTSSQTVLQQAGDEGRPLIESMDKFVMYKVDRLVQMHRDVSTRAKNMAFVWTTSLKTVTKPLDEMNIMFGSSLGGDGFDTSTWVRLASLTTNLIVTNLKTLVTKDISDADIEAVISPLPKVEEKVQSYEDAYLAVFGLTKDGV